MLFTVKDVVGSYRSRVAFALLCIHVIENSESNGSDYDLRASILGSGDE